MAAGDRALRRSRPSRLGLPLRRPRPSRRGLGPGTVIGVDWSATMAAATVFTLPVPALSLVVQLPDAGR
jgi:hypothetical protein